MLFRDRKEAGVLLGTKLKQLNFGNEVLVVALPRGGVPVAFEIAKILNASLDFLFVKKIGAPGEPELALGAVAESGETAWQDEVIQWFQLDSRRRDQLAEEAHRQVSHAAKKWRASHPQISPSGKTVIIVDDGMATGTTAKVAIQLLKKRNPKNILVAVPVAATSSMKEVSLLATAIALHQPTPFFAVAQWYDKFPQVTDEQVAHTRFSSPFSHQESSI